MRKKIILTLVLIVAVMATIGGIHFLNNNETEDVLTPEDVIANLPEKEEQAVFDKDSDEVIKFLFKDFDGGCVYSLNQKIFLMTENSDEEKVIYYLECATEENCKPIAITTTGNYMILKTDQGEKIAVQMEKSQKERLIESREPIAFDDLPEKEKNSLFELIEE